MPQEEAHRDCLCTNTSWRVVRLLLDVAITTLRAELSSWIDRAQAGEEVIVTDRVTPVARLLPVDAAPLLEQLVHRGVLSKGARR